MTAETPADSRPASRRQRWAAAMALLAMLALAPWAPQAQRSLETTVRIDGSEAEAVTEELTNRFHSPFAHRVVLVLRGLPAADSGEGRLALAQITAALRNEGDVAGTLSYLDGHDPIFMGPAGGGYLLVGIKRGSEAAAEQMRKLRAVSTRLQDQLRSRHPDVAMQWTGEMPLSIDIRKTSADDARAAEQLALPLSLILLLAAFGSVVAALLPIIAGLAAIAMTLGAAALLASHFHMSILIQNLATMIGLGLGIDFALLMVSRFREARAAGACAHAAANTAFRLGGHTLLVSAGTVGIGFAALLTVPISELRSIGVAGLVVALASVLLAVGLVPPLLGALGGRIDAGALPWLGRGGLDRSKGATRAWRHWGLRMALHPWAALLLAGIPVALLAAQSLRLAPGEVRGDLLAPSAESVQGLHGLEAMGQAGVIQALRVIVELPAGFSVDSGQGFGAIARLTDHLARDRRAARVVSISTLGGDAGGASGPAPLPDAIRQSLVRDDGRAALVEIIPAASLTQAAQMDWVGELRRLDAAALTGLRGTALRVGGIPALNRDYANTAAAHLPRVMALVAAGTLVSLFIGFGSVVLAFKAIALNLLSVGAAFGALVLVFQDGHGAGFFGVAGGTGGVFPIVPILTFAIVFGLSMDYEVFLVARVLEARRRGRGESAAIAEAMAATSGLITRAAAIMVVVFGAFTLGNLLIVKMIGFTLAVAVLIDAMVVRTVIGPALLALAGDWNWWPWGLTRARGAWADPS